MLQRLKRPMAGYSPPGPWLRHLTCEPHRHETPILRARDPRILGRDSTRSSLPRDVEASRIGIVHRTIKRNGWAFEFVKICKVCRSGQ